MVCYRGAVRPPFIEGAGDVGVGECDCGYRGAVRPPFIEGGTKMPLSSTSWGCYRGAVRPPFIEGVHVRSSQTRRSPTIGGQSAPPSLKDRCLTLDARLMFPIGGQSAPPSLKGLPLEARPALLRTIGGQSAPPSLKLY